MTTNELAEKAAQLEATLREQDTREAELRLALTHHRHARLATAKQLRDVRRALEAARDEEAAALAGASSERVEP